MKNLSLKIYNERKKRQYDEFDYSEILDTIDVEEEIMFKLEQKELEGILMSLPENYYIILLILNNSKSVFCTSSILHYIKSTQKKFRS